MRDDVSFGVSTRDDGPVTIFGISFVPPLLELVAWIVLEAADIRAQTIPAWLVMALPILTAGVLAALSLMMLVMVIAALDVRSIVFAFLALIISSVVLLTSLDMVGVIELANIWP